MESKHHVILLPGLGDSSYIRGRNQEDLLKFWDVYKLDTHYHGIGWADGEAFRPKLNRILSIIDKYSQNGDQVSLIGISAGASASINAYVERKEVINSVFCVCGKLQNPQTVSAARLQQNPAFNDSLGLLPASYARLDETDRHKILSVRPLADGIVPPRDTIIPGAQAMTIPSVGHSLSIIAALTVFSPGIARFIKSH